MNKDKHDTEFNVHLVIAQQKVALAILQGELIEMGYSPFDVWIPWGTGNWDAWEEEICPP